MDDKPDTNAAILAALTRLGEADAKAIAATAGLGYSTVTKKLRGLADTGQVTRRDPADGPVQWRLAPTGTNADAADQDGAPAAAGTALPAADDADPTATSRELADAPDRDGTQPPDGDTADVPPDGPDPAADPSSGEAQARDGAPAARRRRDRRAPTQPDQPADDGSAASASAAPRRRAGELRGQVLAVLQANPGSPFKVGQVSKALGGASAGAVANALTKLVAAGSAREVCEMPATYQAE